MIEYVKSLPEIYANNYNMINCSFLSFQKENVISSISTEQKPTSFNSNFSDEEENLTKDLLKNII